MAYDKDKQFQRNDVYSKRIRAGKRRTYFFDVRTTKGNDYYLTITESKKRFYDDGYDRHKVFIYKEDFNKFIHTLEEVVDHIKSNLMPDYDFDTFTRDPEDITDNHAEDGQEVQDKVEEIVEEETYSEPVDEAGEKVDDAPAAETPKPDSNSEEVISWD